MKSFLSIFFTFFLIFTVADCQVISEIGLPSPAVAVIDNALSIRANPAGLGVKRAPELFLLSYSRSGGYERNGAIYGKLWILGFGAEFMDEAAYRYNRYFLGVGFDLGMGVKSGFTYNWYRRIDIDGGWNLGLLFRPKSFLSFGLNAVNINSPRVHTNISDNSSIPPNGSLIPVGGKLKPRYNFGVAVRPLKQGLTLSVDGALLKDTNHDYGDSLDWTFRADLEPYRGLNLTIDYKPDAEYFGGGMRVSLPHVRFRTHNYTDDSGTGVGSSYLLHFCFNRLPSFAVPQGRDYVSAALEGPILEEERPWSPFGLHFPTLRRIIKTINRMRDDDRVAGLVLRLGGLDTGFATIQEIREALIDFREEGKKLIVYSESLGNKEYYLASTADEIYMSPSGYLGLTGLSFQTTFMKGTLDKLGVVAELEGIGEYKSAASPFTREGMSASQREAETALLQSFYDEFTADISYNRDIDIDSIDILIDNGPYTASKAYAAGLIDSLVYPDEIEAAVKSVTGEKSRVVQWDRYSRFGEYEYSWDDPFLKRIAVIYATGSIASGNSGYDLLRGRIMGAETISEAIREAREDSRVKAIVMRINSPGGESLASDLIWREVKLTVTGENRKPFIVSMGDVAASGGYYIACMADTIVAHPGTITGSIGVITGKFDLSGLYEKIGFRHETIKRGKHADYFTTTRGWTEEEKELRRRMARELYDEFVDRVSQGRKMSVEEVEKVARGRVWSGDQAWENGLVDEIGTLSHAVQIAMGMAGFMPGEKAAFAFYPRRNWVSVDGMWSSFIEARLNSETLELIKSVNRASSFYDGKILYLMPYEPKIN